jgi:hypothetical protein
MIWDDEDDKKGVSHSTWVPINIYPNLIPEKVGVYIFADDDFDVRIVMRPRSKHCIQNLLVTLSPLGSI